MRVLLTHELHASIGQDGHYYNKDLNTSYESWNKYLEVFDEITVLVRGARPQPNMALGSIITGERVRVCPIPDFNSPVEYIRHYREIISVVADAVRSVDGVILRTPGHVAHLAWRESRKQRAPFAVEVVGDPWDVFGPGGPGGLVRPLVRTLQTLSLKRQCREAIGALYVTQEALQRRYPASGFSVGVSDVELPMEAYVSETTLQTKLEASSIEGGKVRSWRLCMVGSYNTMYKAPDILIKAVALCRERGFNVEVVFVGGGQLVKQLMGLALRCGIQEHVTFIGRRERGLPIRDVLDSADLFVLPSRTEGLPRAMLEAMARGMPCIGSTVGGIPELLDDRVLVQPGSVEGLAGLIERFLTDQGMLAYHANKNLSKSKEYEYSKLRVCRHEFYQRVRDSFAKINRRIRYISS